MVDPKELLREFYLMVFIILPVKLRNFQNIISNQDSKVYLVFVVFLPRLKEKLKISDDYLFEKMMLQLSCQV